MGGRRNWLWGFCFHRTSGAVLEIGLHCVNTFQLVLNLWRSCIIHKSICQVVERPDKVGRTAS